MPHLSFFCKSDYRFFLNVEDFSPQLAFSVYLESGHWIKSRQAAAVLQQLQPKASAASGQISFKVGGAIFFPMYSFFKKEKACSGQLSLPLH